MVQSKLSLRRPLVVLDVETTGVLVRHDRVVEFAAIKVWPDGRITQRLDRFNPERAIPAAASTVHGIRTEHVAHEPPFRTRARDLAMFLAGSDLAGFNLLSFDLPILDAEFLRANLQWNRSEVAIIDVMRIFHARETLPRRTLSDAVQFYCHQPHTRAHSALGDVQATWAILLAQLDRYPDLPRSVVELAQWRAPQPSNWIDSRRTLYLENGAVMVGFGKHRGVSLQELAASPETRSYLTWMLQQDFSDPVKALVRAALTGAPMPFPGGVAPKHPPRSGA